MSYLLFAGNDYYPYGGADDLQGKFDTVDEAIAAHDPNKYDEPWAHVFCLESLSIVKEFHDEEWF